MLIAAMSSEVKVIGVCGGLLSFFCAVALLVAFWPRDKPLFPEVLFVLAFAGWFGALVCAALATIIEGCTRVS